MDGSKEFPSHVLNFSPPIFKTEVKEVQKKGKKTHLQCFLFTCVFGHFFQAVSLCFFSTIPRIGENIQKFHNCCGKHFFMQLPVSKKTCRKYNLFFNVDFLNI